MKTDLVFEANYGYWYNLANERLWRRVDFLLNLAQLVGGSATVVAFLNKMPNVGIIIGVGLSVVGALALLLQPAIKALQHEQAKCRFLELRHKAPEMSEEDLRRVVGEAQRALSGVRSLANPAYNATIEAMGHSSSGRVNLSMLERVADALA